MTVATSRHGSVLVVTMAREEKRNALNEAITAGIDAAMNEIEDDPTLWCGILTGGTRVFSAGADLAAGPGEPTERGGIVGLINRQRTKPLIAAVEGLALGPTSAAGPNTSRGRWVASSGGAKPLQDRWCH